MSVDFKDIVGAPSGTLAAFGGKKGKALLSHANSMAGQVASGADIEVSLQFLRRVSKGKKCGKKQTKRAVRTLEKLAILALADPGINGLPDKDSQGATDSLPAREPKVGRKSGKGKKANKKCQKTAKRIGCGKAKGNKGGKHDKSRRNESGGKSKHKDVSDRKDASPQGGSEGPWRESWSSHEEPRKEGYASLGSSVGSGMSSEPQRFASESAFSADAAQPEGAAGRKRAGVLPESISDKLGEGANRYIEELFRVALERELLGILEQEARRWARSTLEAAGFNVVHAIGEPDAKEIHGQDARAPRDFQAEREGAPAASAADSAASAFAAAEASSFEGAGLDDAPTSPVAYGAPGGVAFAPDTLRSREIGWQPGTASQEDSSRGDAAAGFPASADNASHGRSSLLRSHPSEPQSPAVIAPESYSTPSDKEIQILDYLEDHPEATQADLAKKMFISRSTVADYTASLKSKGLLEREGSRRAGHWVVTRS